MMTRHYCEISTDNGAAAKIITPKGHHGHVVTIDIDAGLKWDREGLLKLASTISGIAQTLPA